MVYTVKNVDRYFWLKHFKRQVINFLRTDKRERDKDFVVDRYSKSGTRDLQYYFDDSLKRDSVVDGRIKIATHKDIRDRHISIISEFIDEHKPSRVLEIGAGTSINIYLLNRRYPHIEFHGVDLVPDRVATGVDYFRKNFGFEPSTTVGDATSLPFDDEQFDLVYSMHCFEQMENYLEKSVQEAHRVCKKQLVFMEPDWKYSNLTQKLFLVNNDYLVSLDKVLQQFGRRYSHTKISTYHNPLNRTGLFAVDCSRQMIEG